MSDELITVGQFTFTRGEAAMVFVYGVLRSLKDKGLVDEGDLRASIRGIAVFDQLHASGFRPTHEEVQLSMAAIQRHCSDDRFALTPVGHAVAKRIPQ